MMKAPTSYVAEVDAAALGGAGACVFMGMYANTKKCQISISYDTTINSGLHYNKSNSNVYTIMCLSCWLRK
jgi:hypothetical protein